MMRRFGTFGLFVVVVTALVFTLGLTGCDLLGEEEDSKKKSSGPSIGDEGEAGGVIFFVDEDGTFEWDYLEAWTADEEGLFQWKTENTATPGTNNLTGDGIRNTDVILAREGEEHPAAETVLEADHGGFGDWFLPSQNELVHMYAAREEIGGFEAGLYWSSSGAGVERAVLVGFDPDSHLAGATTQVNKNILHRVRLARASFPEVEDNGEDE